ncbi:MAG TPA: tyrosine--tRNA ligase, partial [Clostridiales bacterium]|nr:tyrosine--tRNA ligase [Clostridiales bacterium]
GEEEAKKAKAAAKALFGGGAGSADMPTLELSDSDLTDGGADIMTLLVKTGLCPSKSDARRNIQQGGVTANDEKVSDISKAFRAEELREAVILKRGKKNFYKVVLK